MYGSVSSLENPISLFSLTKEDNTLMHLAQPMLQIYKQFVFIFHFTTVHCCILNLSTGFPFLFLLHNDYILSPTLLADTQSKFLSFFCVHTYHSCSSASEPNVISRSSAAISLLHTRIRLSSASSFDSRFTLPYQTISLSITA